jgi:hypothetical protein
VGLGGFRVGGWVGFTMEAARAARGPWALGVHGGLRGTLRAGGAHTRGPLGVEYWPALRAR